MVMVPSFIKHCGSLETHDNDTQGTMFSVTYGEGSFIYVGPYRLMTYRAQSFR